MKIIQWCLLFCFVSFSVCLFGQKIKSKSLPIEGSSVLKSIFPAWDESVTYAFIVPGKLNYYDGKRGYAGNGAAIQLDIPGIKGKRVKPEENPDYTIELICDGLRAPGKKNRNYNIMGGGKVGIIRYRFETSLAVMDKAGNLVKVFVLHDKTPLKTVFHPHFLDESSGVDHKAEVEATGGFVSEDALEYAYGTKLSKEGIKQRNNVYARIEYNALHSSVETAKLLLTASYGEQKLPMAVSIVDVHDKQKVAYPELVKEINELTELIKRYMDDPRQADIQSDLAAVGERFFEHCQEEGVSKSMLEICGLNSAIAYLLGQKADEACKVYKKAESAISIFSKARAFFVADFSIFNARVYAAKDTGTVNCVVPLGLKERYDYIDMVREDSVELEKRMKNDMEYKRILAHNVVDVPGQIQTLRGDKYEGKIHIYFVKLPVNPEGVVYSTTAYVFFDGYKEGMPVDCKQIKDITVGERIFEPLTEHREVTSKLEKILLGNELNISKLFEKLYENEDYALYRDWSNYQEEVYLIKNKMLPYACSYNDILTLSPVAAAYYENRSDVQEHIKNNEFQSSDFESAKKLVNILSK